MGRKRSLSFPKNPTRDRFYYWKKFQLIVGGGIYGSVLLGYHIEKYSTTFDNNKNTFQFGAFYNFGLAYQLNETYNINLKYQFSKDITNLYVEPMSSPGGARYELPYKIYGGFLQLGLKYKLILKKAGSSTK